MPFRLERYHGQPTRTCDGLQWREAFGVAYGHRGSCTAIPAECPHRAPWRPERFDKRTPDHVTTPPAMIRSDTSADSSNMMCPKVCMMSHSAPVGMTRVWPLPMSMASIVGHVRV